MKETNKLTQLTPMMQQYCSIKERYKNYLLFYRLGDFYELFYDDAFIVSKELGLVLTKRSDVPMCGVPWHASEMYLTKLVKAGFRIAICEQLETPQEAKKRGGSKATVERNVTRIITKGTLIEQSMLSEKSNNFLLAISNLSSNNNLAIAYTDVSTGKFLVEEITDTDLLSSITKIAPSEIICSDELLSQRKFLDILSNYKFIIRSIPNSKFSKFSTSDRVNKFFGVKFLDILGNLSKQALEAITAIVEYITDVYKSVDIKLDFPKLIKSSDYMYLDSFTRKSLELTVSQSGDKKSSLLSNIDKTLTSQGSRMLSMWLMEPLINISKINKRLDFVEFFVNHREILNKLSKVLSDFPDVERAISRILLNKAGPRDLKCVCIALNSSFQIKQILKEFAIFDNMNFYFNELTSLVDDLYSALSENLPSLAREGNFIKKGYDKELDEYINMLENGESIIKSLQLKYVKETGIPNLKIKNNSLIGYFIELSPNFVSKIPYNFIHRQSLASSLRYTSEELIDIADKIYSAETNVKQREILIFNDLVEKVSKLSSFIKDISNNISFLDIVASFARLAIENRYTRPQICEENILDIKKGRHPVVENNLKNNGSNFIENDCEITLQNPVSILTGPNMGGKSTYLRQNAIIIIMAQIGSFVPADFAKIGIVDRIFSRVGASDDISSGRSTFMVEMIETATILHNATKNSFVILDEIGRGTSTYDGLAIAWAVIEEIATNIKSRTIFATHYHELKALKETLPEINFLTVDVKEWNNEIVFLHKIKQGFADKSYGINVAELAGFPENVLKRAESLLESLT